jgi:hypothetical protein
MTFPLTVVSRNEIEPHTFPETHANIKSTNAEKQQKRPGRAGDATMLVRWWWWWVEEGVWVVRNRARVGLVWFYGIVMERGRRRRVQTTKHGFISFGHSLHYTRRHSSGPLLCSRLISGLALFSSKTPFTTPLFLDFLRSVIRRRESVISMRFDRVVIGFVR